LKKKFLALLLSATVLSVGLMGFTCGGYDSVFVPAAEAAAEQSASGTPLADARVRQALSYAIDMDLIVDAIFEGKAETAISMTAPSDWLAPGLPDYSYNPEKARQLLAEANWPSDYILDVVYYYDDQQTVDFLTIIGQFWADVGVKAQFRKLEGDLPSQLWVPPADRVNGPSVILWDVAYAAVSALVEHEFYDRYSSTASNNSTVPKDAALDELIAASNATANVDEQKEIFMEIQRIIAENVYSMPLYHQVVFIFISDNLDVGGIDHGNDQFSYEKNVLDWVTKRDNGLIYTNGGPLEFFSSIHVNPGQYLYQEFVFERLINADYNLNPTDGMLAESYTVSEDGKTIVFNLREGLKWHDGADLTPDDVKFTIELLAKTPGTNTIASGTFRAIRGAGDYLTGDADGIEGIVIDGNTITIEFENVAANALMTFSQWPVLPKHLLGDVDPNTLQQHAFWQKPIGSGPYKVDEVVLNNYTTLVRWDGYYKTGTGNVQTIHMHASAETDSNLVVNTQAGIIDYAYSKNTDDAIAIEGMDHVSSIVANVRYTRCFYINQFPHEPNIR